MHQVIGAFAGASYHLDHGHTDVNAVVKISINAIFSNRAGDNNELILFFFFNSTQPFLSTIMSFSIFCIQPYYDFIETGFF